EVRRIYQCIMDSNFLKVINAIINYILSRLKPPTLIFIDVRTKKYSPYLFGTITNLVKVEIA
ncbi:hypothetical protein, partial [Staphylococcus equorum]